MKELHNASSRPLLLLVFLAARPSSAQNSAQPVVADYFDCTKPKSDQNGKHGVEQLTTAVERKLGAD
jgi:hypothetical protein